MVGENRKRVTETIVDGDPEIETERRDETTMKPKEMNQPIDQSVSQKRVAMTRGRKGGKGKGKREMGKGTHTY